MCNVCGMTYRAVYMIMVPYTGFEIGPIRVSETCQNSSGQVKCRYMVIRWTSQFFDCNLKLGLLKSRKDSWQSGMSHADTGEDDVSLAGVLQDAVGHTPGVKSADITGRRFCRLYCSSK